MVDRGLEPRLGQTKDYKIGICCFPAKHAALTRKSKDLLARKQDNLSADSCFSDLILYMAISRHFFLIHEVMNIHETIVTRLNFFNIFITKKSILLCLYPLNRHLEFLFDHVHNYFYFKRCQTGRKIYHFASHQQ